MRAALAAGLCALVVAPLATAGELKGRLLLDDKPAKGVTVSALVFESPLEEARREARFQEAPKPLASITTRPDGSFALLLSGPALAPGTSIRLALSGGGVAPGRVWGVYDAGDSEELGDLHATRANALAGKVLDARGKPVAGATVTLWSAASAELEQVPVLASTGPDGTFRLDQAGERGNRVRVEAPGQALVELSDLRAGALRKPVQLAAGRTAEGVVLKADRRTPAAGAVMRFEGQGSTRWVEAGPDGSFRLTGLPHGAGALAADAGELGQARVPLAEGPARTTLVLAPTATISGRVVDVASGLPIARMRVLARGPSGLFMARSGGDGRYALLGLPGQTYRLSADDPRYVPWSLESQTVAAGAVLSRDVLLKPGASFQGRVLDEHGAPIEGARALLASPHERGFSRLLRLALMRGASFRSGPDGVFTATRVEAGDGQSLNVRHDDYEARTLGGIDLKPGSANPKLTIVLRRGLSVRGIVKDARGQPLAEAKLELSRSYAFQSRGGRSQFSFSGGPEGRPKRTTGVEGRFAFEGLTAADYTLTVSKPGFSRASLDPVKLAEGKRVEPLEITLSTGATISGFVRDKAGKGVAGMRLGARVAGAARGPGGLIFAEGGTGADGAFFVEGLTPGTAYDLQLLSPVGFGPRKPGVVAPAEGVEIVTAGSGAIAGRVTDSEGARPLTDFLVSYSEPEGGAGGLRMVMRGPSRQGGPGDPVSVHADDGQFTLTDVPVGKWDVEVRAEGYQAARVAGVAVEADATSEGVELRLSRGALLTGRVLEAGSSRPIVDAAVKARVQGAELGFRGPDEVGELSVRSDADGRFELKGLSAGTYTVSASHPDWSDATEAVTLEERAASVDLRLAKGSTLGGSVVSGGHPVAGASVSLSAAGEDFGFGQARISDESGRFRFAHLTPGRYALAASLRSESSAPLDVVLQQGQSREDLLLTLAGGAALHGRVTGLPEAELGGVNVNASGPDYFATTRSAADGAFELSGAPVGPITLRASAGDFSSGMRSATVQVLIGEGQGEASVEIRFEPGLRIDGHVTRGGQGLGDLWVRAFPEGQGGRSASGRTDESGAYLLEGLSEGSHVVTASGAGGGSPDVYVQKTVKLTGDTTLDLELPEARLAGMVVEAETGRPLPGATVQVELARGGRAATTSDNNGRFALTSLEPRVYSVGVQKPAYRAESRELTASEDSDERIELRRGEGIGLLAHDGLYGTPLRALAVRVLTGQGATVFSGSVTLDGEGRGEIPSLQPGAYELRADASGYAPVVLPALSVPAPQVALTLTPGGALEIRSGPETQARSGVFARLVLPGGQIYPPWIFSSDGRILLNLPVRRIDNVVPGSYTLQVDGGPSPAVEVHEGDTAVVNLP